MKKFLGVIAASVLLMAGGASAQTGMMGGSGQENTTVSSPDRSAIDAAMQEIYKSQNIVEQKQVNCSKVTDAQLITLGDAVMGYGITEEQHAVMENMMGGEESAMSKQAHTNMGRSYLGCWANYNSGPMMMSMMGGNSNNSIVTMNPREGGSPVNPRGTMDWGSTGWGMMGGSYGFGGITMLLFWVLLILCIVAVVKWLKNN